MDKYIFDIDFETPLRSGKIVAGFLGPQHPKYGADTGTLQHYII